MCWGCGYKLCSKCCITNYCEEFIDYELPSIEKILSLTYYKSLKLLYMILDDLKNILVKCLIKKKSSLLYMINNFFIKYCKGKSYQYLYKKYNIFISLIKQVDNRLTCTSLEIFFLNSHNALTELTKNVIDEKGNIGPIFPFYLDGGHKQLFETIIDYIGYDTNY